MKLRGLVVVALFVMGCSPLHQPGTIDPESEQANSLLGGNGQVTEADSAAFFEQTLHPVLTQNCGSCHGASQFPMHSVADSLEAHNTITQNRLVDFANIESSRLVAKIRGGHQNFPGTVADEIAQGIQAWMDLLLEASAGTGVEDLPVDIPEAIPLAATFKSIHANILLPKCTGCHNPSGAYPSIDYTDYENTLATGELTPGAPNASDMLEACIDGEMPQGAPPLSNEELAALEQWIAEGALNN